MISLPSILPHNLIKEQLTHSIDETINKEDSLYFVCNDKRPFNTSEYILFTKSRGYSNIINHSIYQTNVINLKQLVLISQVI